MKAYPEYKESGVEWLGEVPVEWEVTSLFGVASERSDSNRGMMESNLLSLSYGRIIRKDIEGLDGLLPESFETYQVVQPDDIVMRLTDLQNDKRSLRSAIVNETGIITSAYLALKPVKITARYFAHLLRAYDLQKVFYSMGGGLRQSMKFSDVKRLPVLLPPLTEQRKIAAFLDREVAKIDDLIEEQRRLIALLAEKRQATISHAVTKGLNPNAKLKPSGIDWPQNIPEDWEILSLTRMVKKFVDYRGVTPTKVGSGVPLITATQIKNGRIEHELDPAYITEEEYKSRMTRGWPEIGDVLLTTEAPLGETAQIVDPYVSPGQRIILMKVEPDLISNDYLFTHFRSQFGQNQLWERASGSTASGIRADRLRASLVLVPPLMEQEKIVAHVNQVTSAFEEIQNNANSQITLLQERRSALISAAVTGKIDLRDFDDSILA